MSEPTHDRGSASMPELLERLRVLVLALDTAQTASEHTRSYEACVGIINQIKEALRA